MKLNTLALCLTLTMVTTGCSKMYLSSLESIGIAKRDVMVHRVKKARDTQEDTKEQFQTALDQFTSLTHYDGGDLEKIYKKLNNEYLASVEQAEEVNKRINDIEDVSGALFAEWETELQEYSSASLRNKSKSQLRKTRAQYSQLITAMRRAESKMEPVLKIFKDQVLYLKHNLNAQAISSLKGELSGIKSNVSSLIAAMEQSINEANAFIVTIDKKS